MSKDLLFEIKPKYVPYVRLSHYSIVFMWLLFPITIILLCYRIVTPSLIVIFYILYGCLQLFLDKKNFEVTTYKVYKDRIEFEEGFINHKHTEIKVENIREVHFEQNFIQRSANVGTIRFITAANSSTSSTGIAFVDIENPKDVYMKVKEIYEKI